MDRSIVWIVDTNVLRDIRVIYQAFDFRASWIRCNDSLVLNLMLQQHLDNDFGDIMVLERG